MYETVLVIVVAPSQEGKYGTVASGTFGIRVHKQVCLHLSLSAAGQRLFWSIRSPEME